MALCAATRTEASVFRGMHDAVEQQARDTCNRARTTEAEHITTDVTKAITNAWHAPPLVDRKHGQSCTAFQDLHGSSSDAISLPGQIHDAPAAVALLYVFDAQPGSSCQRMPQPNQQSQRGAITLAFVGSHLG
jgi:hypothetical protein